MPGSWSARRRHACQVVQASWAYTILCCSVVVLIAVARTGAVKHLLILPIAQTNHSRHHRQNANGRVCNFAPTAPQSELQTRDCEVRIYDSTEARRMKVEGISRDHQSHVTGTWHTATKEELPSTEVTPQECSFISRDLLLRSRKVQSQ
jgi:hypothetical protein